MWARGHRSVATLRGITKEESNSDPRRASDAKHLTHAYLFSSTNAEPAVALPNAITSRLGWSPYSRELVRKFLQNNIYPVFLRLGVVPVRGDRPLLTLGASLAALAASSLNVFVFDESSRLRTRSYSRQKSRRSSFACHCAHIMHMSPKRCLSSLK